MYQDYICPFLLRWGLISALFSMCPGAGGRLSPLGSFGTEKSQVTPTYRVDSTS